MIQQLLLQQLAAQPTVFDSESLPGNVQTFIHEQNQQISSTNSEIVNNENIQNTVVQSNSTVEQQIIIGDDIDELEVPSEVPNGTSDNKLIEASTIEDNKYPPINLDYRIYCADPTSELNKATLRCYAQCPPNY